MKKVLIFGGSGQIGRHLIRRLTNKNNLVTVVTRNLHKKGTVLKLGGNPGYIEVIEANIFNEDKLNDLFKDKDICINLVGIISENKKINLQIFTHTFQLFYQKNVKNLN